MKNYKQRIRQLKKEVRDLQDVVKGKDCKINQLLLGHLSIESSDCMPVIQGERSLKNATQFGSTFIHHEVEE
jgi:hypothetical protein